MKTPGNLVKRHTFIPTTTETHENLAPSTSASPAMRRVDSTLPMLSRAAGGDSGTSISVVHVNVTFSGGYPSLRRDTEGARWYGEAPEEYVFGGGEIRKSSECERVCAVDPLSSAP